MERFPDEDRQKRLKLLSLKLQWWSGLELESKLTKATRKQSGLRILDTV